MYNPTEKATHRERHVTLPLWILTIVNRALLKNHRKPSQDPQNSEKYRVRHPGNSNLVALTTEAAGELNILLWDC